MSKDSLDNIIELKTQYDKTPDTTQNEILSKNELFLNEIEKFGNKKEIKTDSLILNEFWVSLISKFITNISLIYTELIPILIFIVVMDIKNISNNYEIIITTLPKLYFFINFVYQFSIILNSLITFSRVIKKTNKIKSFLIFNIIYAFIFYSVSVAVLYIIKKYIYNLLYNEVKKVEKDVKSFIDIIDLFDDLFDLLLKFIGNFLANFNTNLDILIIGSLYIFLFKNPNKLIGKKLFYFRLMSILPILFILISLIYRALLKKEIISLNIYVSPIFLGPKVSIFGFFITTLLYLKYISKEYEIFDENDYIFPKVFSKIGMKIFFCFALIEIIVYYLLPFYKFIGIGNQYLSIFAVPFIILYDYKKTKKIYCYMCGKRNMTNFIILYISFFLYILIFILGFFDVSVFVFIVQMFIDYIVKNIKKYSKEIKKFLDIINSLI